MMAYDNNFVLCVLHNGSPVREIGNTVHLPFHSEYKVRLKNKHGHLKAKARVWVDGRKASNLGDLILHPGETLDLERFLDSSMTRGNRFKFVPLSDGRVNDPTDPENGIIKVEFYREKEYRLRDHRIVDWPRPWPGPKGFGTGDYTNDIHWTNCSTRSSNGLIGSSGGGGTSTSSTYYVGDAVPCSLGVADSAGATVEGSVSGQSFVYGSDFDTETFPVTLTLRVRGLERGRWDDEFEVSTPRPHRRRRQRRMIKFCPNCGGRRHRQADHFCQRCGTAYHPRYENERGRIVK
jgi:hypothetical protein